MLTNIKKHKKNKAYYYDFSININCPIIDIILNELIV